MQSGYTYFSTEGYTRLNNVFFVSGGGRFCPVKN